MTYTVDNTAPVVSISSPVEGTYLPSSDVHLIWSGDGSSYGLILDTEPWVIGVSSPHIFLGVMDGSHNVIVKAWDLAGNSAEDIVSFSVDTTQDQYELTIVSAHAPVTKSPDQELYTYGTPVTLTLGTVESGWTFTGWSANVIAGVVTMNADTTVTASFTQDQGRIVTLLEYKGETQGEYSDEARLSAILTTIDGIPLPNKVIEFMFDGAVYQATTNSLGNATTTILLNIHPGALEVKATFDEDSLYFGSQSNTWSFTIIKEWAGPVYTGDTVVPTTNSVINLRATVYDDEDGHLGDMASDHGPLLHLLRIGQHDARMDRNGLCSKHNDTRSRNCREGRSVVGREHLHRHSPSGR